MTEPTRPHIREMTADDCPAVAEVRVRGWQHAYAGVVPRTYLDAMSVEEETAVRREQFGEGAGRAVNLVAERDGRVVGWGCLGPGRDEDAPAGAAELYTLYVLPAYLSTGVGRALMAALTARAEARGSRVLLLWVLAGNARARAFYARDGLRPDGAEASFEIAGVAVRELRYARRLSASSAAAPSLG
ncbi:MULTISPECIES: GNAT family N-acetyltransferase [unclassified Streptomyces]|uniref:GNAT family N-acetyltransferase n=1 Tax=unclassified Streptomyces TaxID=2593676 RepID=UPI002E2D2A2E|nr:GNAT family N-acetyltransferase [Streptomyces sp. NBC_01429]